MGEAVLEEGEEGVEVCDDCLLFLEDGERVRGEIEEFIDFILLLRLDLGSLSGEEVLFLFWGCYILSLLLAGAELVDFIDLFIIEFILVFCEKFNGFGGLDFLFLFF